MAAKQWATIEDVNRVEERAELIDGEIVILGPDGAMPGQAAAEMFVSLRECAKGRPCGRATQGRVVYEVDLPHRKSFSPHAGLHAGPPTGMKFLQGAPVVAVEIRNRWDYGSAVEVSRAAKRADYFAAGTKVVWDVDLLGPDVVRKYTRESLDEPQVFRRGEMADAEPALPDWRMPVDDLFEE
jgi:hypothetical protein